MKYLFFLLIMCIVTGCESTQKKMDKIIFLHHSTGKQIWLGNTNKIAGKLLRKSDVKTYFKKYNKKNKTNYLIEERIFPKETPYGWKNYPFDYFNIWVKNAGTVPYLEEPTLEILTRDYDMIIFKHCYPVSNIKEDTGAPDINSEEKRIENYKLQYDALKSKMHEFPDNKFIIWTPAVHVSGLITEDEAKRTREFHNWIMNEWDQKGDNIFVWDFYSLETEGGLYFLDEYSSGPGNSHPNRTFSSKAALSFCEFIVKVINSKSEN